MFEDRTGIVIYSFIRFRTFRNAVVLKSVHAYTTESLRTEKRLSLMNDGARTSVVKKLQLFLYQWWTQRDNDVLVTPLKTKIKQFSEK